MPYLKLTTHVDLANGEEDVEVVVEFDYTRGAPAVYYLRNGDPGYPAEPDDVDNITIHRGDSGVELSEADLTQKSMDRITERCYEYGAENHEHD